MKNRYLLLAVIASTVMLAGCFDGSSSSSSSSDTATASVRVLHASPDAPAVDIAIDGEVILNDVEFQQGTGYLEVPAGTREVTILAGGSEVLTESFELGEGESFSIIALNNVADIELAALDDTERRTNETADVTVVHASPIAGNVDVNVTAADAELPVMPTLGNVPFGADTTLEDQPAGDYQVRIASAGNPEIVYDSGTLPVSSDVTAVAVNSLKGVSPVSLIIWAEADPAVTTVLDNSAEVRVVHAVDSVDVDVFVDGEAVATNFSYTTFSDYLVVPAGDRDVAVASAGQGVGNAIATLSDTLSVERGESYTVIAAGDSNSLEETQLIVLLDRRVADDEAQADVRLVHAAFAPGAQPVDIFVLPPSEDPVAGEANFPDVFFGDDTGYTTLPAANYDVTIAGAGGTMPAIAGTQDLAFPAGSVTTAIAIGAGVDSLDALLLEDVR